MPRVTVLVGGSKGRTGETVRRFWHKGEKRFWLEVRLDKRTVCNGPEEDFKEITDEPREEDEDR